MYTQLIEDIRTILDDIPAIREVFSYPIPGSPTKSPAVVFFPDRLNNAYSSNADNERAYTFSLFVIIDLAGSNEQTVFTTVLPSVVDSIFTAFDAAWDGGATDDGRRIWNLLESGVWGFEEDKSGKRAFAELSLTIRTTVPV